MRRPLASLSLIVLLTSLSRCALTPPAVAPVADNAPPAPYGLTLEEEALVLRLEDRREFDSVAAARWLTHPNSTHRRRMALALGRIGQATFADKNGDGEKQADEKMAGVDALIAASSDPDVNVRRSIAFALGEIGDPAAVETLFTLSRDSEHADIASESVEALSKMAASVPLPRFLQLTGAEISTGVRAHAIRFLFRFNNDEASEVAVRSLGDTSPGIRREASYSLSRRPLASGRKQLELLLTDPDTLTRSYAARALGKIAEAESLRPLLNATGDPHPWVRSNVAVAIAQVAAKVPASIATPSILDDIAKITALTEDPDPGTRASSLEALSHYAVKNRTARARLDQIAVNGSRWERELAAGAIASRFGLADVKRLGLIAKDASWPTVRALEASATMKDEGAARFRMEALASPDAMVRSAAVGAIPDDRVNEEIELIRRTLEDPDVVVRANAIDRYGLTTTDSPAQRIESLKRSGEKRASDGMPDPMNDARLSAIRAIASIEDPGREAYLRGLLTDSDPVVRRVAADLIVEKLKKNRPQFTPLAVDRPIQDYIEIAQWSREPHTATIHMTRGVIQLVLLPIDAPMTTRNFADLARKGFFDNTSFMRVVPNFVIQGGDPRNDMNGGPGYAIRDEINTQRYTRGAVGMALSGPDTGGSQFFITHSPQPHLDGGYTIFARVVDGMGGVVDQTERGDKVTTIRIDESSPQKSVDFAPSEKVPLPTEIGRLTPDHLMATVPEYRERKASYKPDSSVVEMIASSLVPGDHVEVFLGTWCPDSQREVPKFLSVLETLKNDYHAELPVEFVAIDRAKRNPEPLTRGKSVEKVATFILYRGDQEIGRIVETPEGLIEDNMLKLLATKK